MKKDLKLLAKHHFDVIEKKWKWVVTGDSKKIGHIGMHHRDRVNNADYWINWNPFGDLKDAIGLARSMGVTIDFQTYNVSFGNNHERFFTVGEEDGCDLTLCKAICKVVLKGIKDAR